MTECHRSRFSIASPCVRVLVGAWIARLPPAAARSIGSWLRLYYQSHHLATSGAHPEAFGASPIGAAIPVRWQAHRTMIDPPDLFLAPQFQATVADRPRPRPNVLLWMGPDVIAALLALLFANRLHLLQPGSGTWSRPWRPPDSFAESGSSDIRLNTQADKLRLQS